MKNYFPFTDIASKADWDKPIELPKPGERPEVPIKQEPITPGHLPEPPETIPNERPEPTMPSKIPEPEKPGS